MDDSPLFLPAFFLPDQNEGEVVLEIEQMIERQTAIMSAIDGNLPANQVLDLLDHQGFDVDEFIDDLNIYGEGW